MSERQPELPLFTLADNEANGNRKYGHIALLREGQRASEAFFADTGRHLTFSAQFGGAMTPETVRQLAAELADWADRKQAKS